MRNHKQTVFACLLVLLALFAYLQVMPPSFNSDDSPETTLAYVTLGIQHPPGYPLATVTGKVFMEIPLGSYMFRANLMAAAMNIAAAFFIFLIALGLIGNEKQPFGAREYACALLASALYLFSSTAWLQGIIAKGSIYALHAALTACAVWLLIKAKRGIRYLYLASLVYGLSLGNHMQSSAVIFQALTAYVFLSYGKKAGIKPLMWCAIFALLGASVNLFVFVRSLSSPVYAWGDIRTINDFIWLITRAQYAGMEVKHTFSDTLNLLGYHAGNYTLKEYIPFIGLLVLPGVYILSVKKPAEAILLAGAPVLLVVSVAMVATPPPNTQWLIKPYLASSYLFSSIIIAYAAYFMLLRLKTNTAAGIMAAIACAGFFVNAPDYRRYFTGYDYMNNLKKTMRPGSVLICEGDMNIGAALYGTLVMKHDYAPYIPVVSLYGWYKEQAERNYKGRITLPPQSGDVKANIENVVRLNPERECYYTNVFTEQWVNGLLPQPRGVLNKVTIAPALQVITDNPIKLYSYRGYIPEKLRSAEFTKRLIDQNYANAYYKVADSLRVSNMNAQAIAFYRRGIYFLENDGAYVNMGLAYYAVNMLDKAREAWEKAIKLNPKNAVAYSNMSFIYIAKDDVNSAVEFARRALEIDPNNATAAQVINALGSRVPKTR